MHYLALVCQIFCCLCFPLSNPIVRVCLTSGDGQVDFEEFMTILGPKLLSSDNREGFLGNTIDNIFWQVKDIVSYHSQSSSFPSSILCPSLSLTHACSHP